MKNVYIIFLYIILLTLTDSCRNSNKIPAEKKYEPANTVINHEIIEFSKPFNNSKFKLGETITFEIKKINDTINLDSVKIFINGENIGTLNENNYKTNWDSKNSKLGQIIVIAKVYKLKNVLQSTSVILQILSDIKPTQYGYQIIKTYPHDKNAYTQGLIYEDGYYYESDGQYGKSLLRKVKLETGEVVNSVSLDNTIFAEGIALCNNQIFQLTWREQTGYVYNKRTFKQIRKFSYDIAEGWGLTFDGKNFLMTDGSNNVYFMDTVYFTQQSKIEVMDDEGPVQNLNELEYIDGKLYANVYQQNIVVIINPLNGKVLGKIDFSGLLNKNDIDENTDVLNGIAWNPDKADLLVTGKNWPKLFEVKIYRKK